MISKFYIKNRNLKINVDLQNSCLFKGNKKRRLIHFKKQNKNSFAKKMKKGNKRKRLYE